MRQRLPKPVLGPKHKRDWPHTSTAQRTAPCEPNCPMRPRLPRAVDIRTVQVVADALFAAPHAVDSAPIRKRSPDAVFCWGLIKAQTGSGSSSSGGFWGCACPQVVGRRQTRAAKAGEEPAAIGTNRSQDTLARSGANHRQVREFSPKRVNDNGNSGPGSTSINTRAYPKSVSIKKI